MKKLIDSIQLLGFSTALALLAVSQTATASEYMTYSPHGNCKVISGTTVDPFGRGLKATSAFAIVQCSLPRIVTATPLHSVFASYKWGGGSFGINGCSVYETPAMGSGIVTTHRTPLRRTTSDQLLTMNVSGAASWSAMTLSCLLYRDDVFYGYVTYSS